jgi:MFS family permease
LLLVMLLTAVTSSGLRPALTSLITQQAGRRQQGVVLGLTQSITSLAQIVAPPIAGFMIEKHWLTEWAFWTGVLYGLALFFQTRHAPSPVAPAG